jgi:TRAP-type mannitol/chloroaromatic compound transport system permease small subunit
MKVLEAYIRTIDKLNERIGFYTSWLTAILVIVVCYDVVVRYLFKDSSVALQELEWHLFALIFMMAAAYTLKIDGHVRVDLFHSKLSEKKKAWINFLGAIFFLIPFCIIVIISSENFVLTSFKLKETSPDAGGLPARYILKSIIPISFFLLLLQAISLAFKSFLQIADVNYTGEKP